MSHAAKGRKYCSYCDGRCDKDRHRAMSLVDVATALKICSADHFSLLILRLTSTLIRVTAHSLFIFDAVRSYTLQGVETVLSIHTTNKFIIEHYQSFLFLVFIDIWNFQIFVSERSLSQHPLSLSE